MPPTDSSPTAIDDLRTSFERVVASPTPEDLWALQKTLLTIGGAAPARVRAAARAPHARVRAPGGRGVARACRAWGGARASKSESRAASRWSAVLGTAAVGTVSLAELRDTQERSL